MRKYGCTEKPDKVRYADTIRYKTLRRERFSILIKKRGKISLARVFKHSGDRGFLYTLKKRGKSLLQECLNTPAREVFYTY